MIIFLLWLVFYAQDKHAGQTRELPSRAAQVDVNGRNLKSVVVAKVDANGRTQVHSSGKGRHQRSHPSPLRRQKSMPTATTKSAPAAQVDTNSRNLKSTPVAKVNANGCTQVRSGGTSRLQWSHKSQLQRHKSTFVVAISSRLQWSQS
jgi:hypothetical protein